MRILPVIAVAGLLAGCQKSHSFPGNGNVTPVNEGAMPTPAEVLGVSGTTTPAGTPGAVASSPEPATGGASPGG